MERDAKCEKSPATTKPTTARFQRISNLLCLKVGDTLATEKFGLCSCKSSDQLGNATQHRAAVPRTHPLETGRPFPPKLPAPPETSCHSAYQRGYCKENRRKIENVQHLGPHGPAES